MEYAAERPDLKPVAEEKESGVIIVLGDSSSISLQPLKSRTERINIMFVFLKYFIIQII
jgi:hypothetical protein